MKFEKRASIVEAAAHAMARSIKRVWPLSDANLSNKIEYKLSQIAASRGDGRLEETFNGGRTVRFTVMTNTIGIAGWPGHWDVIGLDENGNAVPEWRNLGGTRGGALGGHTVTNQTITETLDAGFAPPTGIGGPFFLRPPTHTQTKEAGFSMYMLKGTLKILTAIVLVLVAPHAARATDNAAIVAPDACFQIFDFSYPKGRPEIDMLLELQQDAFKSLGIAGEKSITPSIASLWANGFSVYFGRPCAAARQDFAGLVENYNQQSARIKVTPSPLPLTPKTLSCSTQAHENCPSAHPENQIAIGKPDDSQSPSSDTSNANHNTPPLPAQCFALFKAAYPAAISNIFEQNALRHAFLNHLSNSARQHNIKGLSGSYMGDGQMIIWPTTSCAQSAPIIRQLIETQNTQSQNIDMHFRTNDVDWYDAYCGLGHTSASCPAANNVAINK